MCIRDSIEDIAERGPQFAGQLIAELVDQGFVEAHWGDFLRIGLRLLAPAGDEDSAAEISEQDRRNNQGCLLYTSRCV